MPDSNIKRLLKFITRPLVLILILTGTHSFAFTKNGDTARVATFKFKTVVIDAGHGGKDPGAGRGTSVEKTVALAVALKLRDMINADLPSVNVIMTRSTDVFIELHKRAQIANDAKANLFISIHCNSSPQTEGTRRGAEILVYGYSRKGEQMEAIRENASIYQEKDYAKKYSGYTTNDPTYFIVLNAFMQKYRDQAIKFGKMVSDEFAEHDGRRSEGVHEQSLLVLANAGLPGVLIETGFINTPADAKYLMSADGQSEMAASILRALKKYKKSFERG